MVYTCGGILFSLKKDMLTQAATWMNIEDIMPSEISQTPKAKYCISLVIWHTVLLVLAMPYFLCSDVFIAGPC